MPLPADSHVHSEWSWDAPAGSMERSCARAIELGLPAVAFTEHADYTRWAPLPGDPDEYELLKPYADEDGMLTPPRLDVDGYLESLSRCRDRFPGLRIISGVEIGEPHRHSALAAELLASGEFDRVLGSLHSMPVGDRFVEPGSLYRHRPAADVLRDYLAEIPSLIAGFTSFGVLAHIDYAVRYWPPTAEPFEPKAFEDEFRHALRALADSGRALEVNTVVPLDPQIVAWWTDEGGEAVTFGSDAHEPTGLSRGFSDAAAMVEGHGFRPGRHPQDCWTRSR